jgi:hypothetical protein
LLKARLPMLEQLPEMGDEDMPPSPAADQKGARL